jgi:predicted secreted protein
VEEALVAEALAAFQARAELVRKSLGAGGYAIDAISIDTGGQFPRPMAYQEMRAMAADVARPSVEGGESRITVGVNGTIALE